MVTNKHFLLKAEKGEKKDSSSESTMEQRKLKVLFVSSGNIKNAQIVPFIRVQAESLANENVDVEFFRIQGKGFFGYLKNIKELRKKIISQKFDLIHAHFTLSGWVTVLTFSGKPIVISLMGTDALGRIGRSGDIFRINKYLTLLTYLIQPFVNIIISKSKNIESYVWQKSKSYILPNGVDLNAFDGSRVSCRQELGLKENQKYVLFLGNPEDTNKNISLLKSIEGPLNMNGFEIINPYPIPHQKVPKFLSSVDVLVMCSFQEGSPNVVKEAMASNCKGVFTDVGDVREQVDGTEGYRVINRNAQDLLKGILEVNEDKTCLGRKTLLERGLDASNIAKKLREIYDSLKS
jgi:teichuronic acid biosynthesis glycosyltransferase TuaC